jgi:hypothetical protein
VNLYCPATHCRHGKARLTARQTKPEAEELHDEYRRKGWADTPSDAISLTILCKLLILQLLPFASITSTELHKDGQ